MKHKYIFLFVTIFIFIAGAFSIAKVMAMNNQNSSVVVAKIMAISLGAAPDTLSLEVTFVSHDIFDFVILQIPISGSSREMNRNTREALENAIIGSPDNPLAGEPVLGKDDTLILLGAAEKL